MRLENIMEVDFIPILISWLGAAIAAGVGAYFGAYLSKKGENLATKEDVADITRLEEEVRHDFRTLSERIRAIGSMRIAAIDRRLEAHQQAYSLWLKLLRSVHNERNTEQIAQCERWWEANNLYLDPSVRKAFKQACAAAAVHPLFLQGERSQEAIQQIKENWAQIVDVGEAIENAVKLPSISEVLDIPPADPT
jgi:hypothetical protein